MKNSLFLNTLQNRFGFDFTMFFTICMFCLSCVKKNMAKINNELVNPELRSVTLDALNRANPGDRVVFLSRKDGTPKFSFGYFKQRLSLTSFAVTPSYQVESVLTDSNSRRYPGVIYSETLDHLKIGANDCTRYSVLRSSITSAQAFGIDIPVSSVTTWLSAIESRIITHIQSNKLPAETFHLDDVVFGTFAKQGDYLLAPKKDVSDGREMGRFVSFNHGCLFLDKTSEKLGAVAIAHIDLDKFKALESSVVFSLPTPGEIFTPLQNNVVVIGDVHGDRSQLLSALQIANLIDERGQWIGKRTIGVQVGDVIDRGEDDIEVLLTLQKIRKQAIEAGGDFITLLGNHEIMNVTGDLRYALPESNRGVTINPPEEGAFPKTRVAQRLEGFKPGGAFAKYMSSFPVAVKIGKTVFVHAGITLEQLALFSEKTSADGYPYPLQAMNLMAFQWLRQEEWSLTQYSSKPKTYAMPPFLDSESKSAPMPPTWTRIYGSKNPACAELKKVLDALGATRMVVGHTVQDAGISSACGESLFRVDIGLSRGYDGAKPQVLVITGDRARVLQ